MPAESAVCNGNQTAIHSDFINYEIDSHIKYFTFFIDANSIVNYKHKKALIVIIFLTIKALNNVVYKNICMIKPVMSSIIAPPKREEI